MMIVRGILFLGQVMMDQLQAGFMRGTRKRYEDIQISNLFDAPSSNVSRVVTRGIFKDHPIKI
jgi:hypothetical protein